MLLARIWHPVRVFIMKTELHRWTNHDTPVVLQALTKKRRGPSNA